MQYQKIEYKASYGTAEQLPPGGKPELVFSGRSNVGKSSAINRICGRRSLARTSSTPGKTTTINFYDAVDAMLVDLPGYGYAKRSQSEKKRWSGLIEGYFGGERDIRLVVQLIDMRHPPSADDAMMLDFLMDNGFPFVLLLTKADKLNRTQRAERLAGFAREIPEWDSLTAVAFSSVTGEGVEELRAILEDVLLEDED